MSVDDFWTHLRMGLVAWKINHVIRGLEFLVLHPDLWGGERPWRWNQPPMANDLMIMPM